MTVVTAPARLPIPGGNPDAPMLDGLSRTGVVSATFTAPEERTWTERSHLGLVKTTFSARRELASDVVAIPRPLFGGEGHPMHAAEQDFGFDKFLPITGGTFEDAVQAALQLTASSHGGLQPTAVLQGTSGAFYVTPLGTQRYGRGDRSYFDTKSGVQAGYVTRRSDWDVIASSRPGATPHDTPPGLATSTMTNPRLTSVQPLDPAVQAYVLADGFFDLRAGASSQLTPA